MRNRAVTMRALVLGGALLLFPAGSQASPDQPPRLFRSSLTTTTSPCALQVAWGKAPSRSEPSQTPPRGSSAQIHGGSSADRYGGSSADRGGVAGAQDRRTRGAHSRGRTNWSRMSVGRAPSQDGQRSRQGGRDGQDQDDQQGQGGGRQPGFMPSDPYGISSGGRR